MFMRVFEFRRQSRSHSLCSTKLYMVIVSAAIMAGSSSCAVMRRHPVATGVVGGAVIAVGISIATHHSCPHSITNAQGETYRYDGSWPCPNAATYDPGKRK